MEAIEAAIDDNRNLGRNAAGSLFISSKASFVEREMPDPDLR
jgi:hypothetical protein